MAVLDPVPTDHFRIAPISNPRNSSWDPAIVLATYPKVLAALAQDHPLLFFTSTYQSVVNALSDIIPRRDATLLCRHVKEEYSTEKDVILERYGLAAQAARAVTAVGQDQTRLTREHQARQGASELASPIQRNF